MKVIITKDNKDGKVNDVIDVSAGYATNFLIKKGLAIPFNSKTSHMLKNKIMNLEDQEKINIENATKVKEAIEKNKLEFKLKVTNLVVHGSISKKQINKELINKGIKIDPRGIEQVHIASLGITKVEIKIYKSVVAILEVEVQNG